MKTGSEFLESPITPKYIARVTVIVLNWNGKDDTIECLNSLKLIDYSSLDILVVDNGSSDDSVEVIRSEFPDVAVIEAGENLGYAGGNNVGIKYALQQGAEYILVLNNDTIVDPNLVDAFIEAANAYPEAGILNAKIYYYSEPHKIWAVGGGWNKNNCDLILIGLGEIDDGIIYKEPFEVDYAIGCALFFHRTVVERIGFIEDKFFLNFEEIDWCSRARKAGYKIYSIPAAKIWHKVSASFGGEEAPLRRYYLVRNNMLWAKRNLSLSERFLTAKRMLSGIVPRFSFEGESNYPLLKRLYWEARSFIKEIIKRIRSPHYQAQVFGIFDYIRGRFGECPPAIKKRLLIR